MLTLSMLLTRAELRSTQFSPESLLLLAREIRELIETDVQMVIDEKLPPQILWTESPIAHARRVPKVVLDGIRLSRRRKKRQTKKFDKQARQQLADLPEYYRRNFHFQTDGYLSEESAELYDHQVEMLFAGAADAMRRIVLPDILHELKQRRDKLPLNFLELACGTGAMTKNVRHAFKKARITATDLSASYLNVARRRHLDNIEFVEADAAHLPLQDSSYDMVYSVFLFHELPQDVRREVINEAHRVLKPGGLFVYVDSLQLDDKPEFNHVLKRFPRDFHEPFYRDYSQTPMQSLVEPAGFRKLSTRFGFLAKGEVFRKTI